MDLFNRILESRGYDATFLLPDYADTHDPYLLDGMAEAVNRISIAKDRNELVAICGDYDVDGLTAAALLSESLEAFGVRQTPEPFIPSRFIEGYGLTEAIVRKVIKSGATLIITVDCGSNSLASIQLAKDNKIDVIVTDHHLITAEASRAVAVINPNKTGDSYPYKELAGVGVAFKLVQALTTKLDGLGGGKEKWLLDLVAIGTISDCVPLLGENRILTYWGLRVLSKRRRPGLRALASVSEITDVAINSEAVSFRIGPRLNAAGRMDNALKAYQLLRAVDRKSALELALELDKINACRRKDQQAIVDQAISLIGQNSKDPVIVVYGKSWNHGVAGIAASRLMEVYQKPAIVLADSLNQVLKGSARSFGDFNITEALSDSSRLLLSYGGHSLAAGLSLRRDNLSDFKEGIWQYYKRLGLNNQIKKLLVEEDAEAVLGEINIELFGNLSGLEPYGIGNPKPIMKSNNLRVVSVFLMGADKQHEKIIVEDGLNDKLCLLAFNYKKDWLVETGQTISVYYTVERNNWQGQESVEGRIVRLEHI